MRTTCLLMFTISLLSCSKDIDEISLNGEWKFLASNEVSKTEVLEADYTNWDVLNVPGNWDVQDPYAEYVGKGYYQRYIQIPQNWDGKQVRLKFEAVYQKTRVWLNEELLGSHIGGYTPFEFNITKKVEGGGIYSIVVEADNSYKRGAWWAWGGISRNVSLVSNNSVRMVYQHLTAIPDFTNNQVDFSIKYKVENNSSEKQSVDAKYSILGTSIEGVLTGDVEANNTGLLEISFSKRLSDFKLWDFNQPNLYQIETSLYQKGELLDQEQDQFGIRKLEVKGEQFFLNNQPVRMNGLNRIHDHPDFGNTEPYSLIKEDMLDIKSLGCNFARLMHAPLAENLLDFCDSIGFLIIEEIPVWGNDDPNSFPDNPLTKKWMKEMIERDFNHPSVVGWSVGNELRDSIPPWGEKLLTPTQYAYVNSMLDYVEDLDTTRLKTYVSNTANGKTINKTNEPYSKVDFICFNSYWDAIESMESIKKNLNGKPVFISEIGKGQIGPAPDAVLSDKLLEYLAKLKEYPFVVGVSLWSYNDYRSNYKGTPQSGFREWGIVDERRNRKAAYEQIKELYQNW
ncbi:MAG: glycoside hydrolase family 2 [Reichenbachiella sp.]